MSREFTAQFQREQLHSAAQDGDLPRVEHLLAAKYPVNRFDDLGKTPLHYAVGGEHLTVVDVLLRAGANVNAHDERLVGNTPLGEYAGSCSYAMAKRLVEAGADPTIPGWMQLTALHRARSAAKSLERQRFSPCCGWPHTGSGDNQPLLWTGPHRVVTLSPIQRSTGASRCRPQSYHAAVAAP